MLVKEELRSQKDSEATQGLAIAEICSHPIPRGTEEEVVLPGSKSWVHLMTAGNLEDIQPSEGYCRV